MADISGSDLSGVNIVITDVSGATVSAAPSLKDLSGAVFVMPVANDLSGAVVAP